MCSSINCSRYSANGSPDRVLRVCDGYGRRLGHCAEQFRFADWDKLPREVRVLRNRTHFVDILNAFHNEDILYYSKRIDIKGVARSLP